MPTRPPTHGLEWYVTHGWGPPSPRRTAHARRVTLSEGGVGPHSVSGTARRRVVVVRRRAPPVLAAAKRRGQGGVPASRVREVAARRPALPAVQRASTARHHAVALHYPAAPHHHRPRVSRRR